MAFYKLQTNIPVVGTVRYMDYKPERDVEKDGKSYHFYPQVCLNGTWDGIGEAKIELPQAVATNILADGLAELKDGNDKEFRWLYKGKVQILKAEEGKTKRTTVLALDAKPAGTPAIIYAHGEALPAKAQPVTAGDDPWAVLGNTYVRARAIARKAWGDEWGNLADDAKAAAVATVFIEANKRGLAPQAVAQPAPQPKPVHTQAAALATATKMRDTFDDFPAALQDDESDPLPF